MLSELKDIICIHCGEKAYWRKAIKEIYVLSEDNELKRQVFWECECRVCGNEDRILWIEG